MNFGPKSFLSKSTLGKSAFTEALLPSRLLSRLSSAARALVSLAFDMFDDFPVLFSKATDWIFQ